MQVVIDTNILASASFSSSGAPAKIFDLLEQERFELVLSEAIVAEYNRVLRYEQVRSRHGWSDTQIEQYIADLKGQALIVEADKSLNVIIIDPTDNKFLECAIARVATYIISGDKHLLTLGEYQGIQILRPAVFIALLAAEDAVE